MDRLQDYLPFWGKLSAGQRQLLEDSVQIRGLAAGTLLSGGAEDCSGLRVVHPQQHPV